MDLTRRSLLAGAAALAISAGPLNTLARAATRTRKVLVIGLDGVLLSRVRDADAPHLKSLMAQGLTATSSLYAEPLAPTLSGPGWSTVLTGVWPDKHNVKDNSFGGHSLAQYPDFLTRIETAKPRLSTYAVASWNAITDTILSSRVDTRISTPAAEYDAGTTSRAVARLRNSNPDAVFVHLDDVDHAGHSQGAASQAYLDAIHGVDSRVGEIVTAVRSRTTYASEDWLIIVTTDHGHTDAGGHGGSSWPERQTFVIATGGTTTPGSVRYDVKLTDVAASALAHLGIPINPAWALDGRPLSQAAPDDFDALRTQLQGPMDETLLGTKVVGFTHTPPPGWSVDNSSMGAAGVTEWRGWTFTTDEFWTKAAPDQERESNVRARNVFAVADGDEWYDMDLTGTFDSTLVSPAWPVTGGKTATLSYVTHYRQESPQKGEVLVSYNGGTPISVQTYTSDVISRAEKLQLNVPAGATDVRVRFRYTGENNWYWAIDQVRVTAN
ncbi:alkaline phosphatase family protein [Streptomyces sp. NPDC007863]|uniref:alkaline phosphatase family protein n=1 Tax=Streptomyces sp. NPDC007863 TaxID=3154894 RepID=UPI0033FB9210